MGSDLVTNREQVEAAAARSAEELGRLDILVAVAGITRDNLLFKMTDDEWDGVRSGDKARAGGSRGGALRRGAGPPRHSGCRSRHHARQPAVQDDRRRVGWGPIG